MVSEHEVSRDSLSPKNRSIRKEIKMEFDRNTRTTISKECRDTDGIATTVGERFFKIWDFMVFDFKLEKTELYVYAIIFAMHKNYNQGFKGSRAYLAKWSNCSLRTVATALRSLATKGYIDKVHKKIDGKVRPVYFINVEKLPTCKVFSAENYARDTWQRFKKEREEAGEIFDRKIIYDFA